MTLIGERFWSLRVDPTRPIPLTPEEPEDFMHEICGKILCDDPDSDEDRVAGKFRVYYANFELAESHGVSALEILDAHQHTLEYAESVVGTNELFSTRLQELLGNDIWNFNFLILDRIEILPKYRGSGVGLVVLRSLIERFGAGAGIAGMKPFPLQFEPNFSTCSSWSRQLKLEKLSADLKISTRKLKQYYGKLGFVEMKSTPFMFRNMSWALPSIDQLLSQRE